MTTEELLDGLLEREGGFTDNPADRGGATNFGITADDLGTWRHLGHAASTEEVKALTPREAKEIFTARYLEPWAWVGDEALKAQLIDFGVLHGVGTTRRHLQAVLGVRIDAWIGPKTMSALASADAHLVNNALVGARCHFISMIVESDKTQATFLRGWLKRAVGFCT